MQLQKYLEKEGISQAEFARRIDHTPGLVWQWLNKRRPIAAEQVLKIEKATEGKVSRYDLRPDLYPKEFASN
jgi:DNA-binding transcriptional regulator YdaS (Cro superfamily)